MKKINNKLTRGGVALFSNSSKERREVFNLGNTSTSFYSMVGDYYE